MNEELRQLRIENKLLREDKQPVDAVAVLVEEGWIWDGDQWQRPPELNQESAYQRGYLDGMAKRPQPLTDEQIMNIVDTQRAKVLFDTARVGYKVARAIEKAHDITGEQK